MTLDFEIFLVIFVSLSISLSKANPIIINADEIQDKDYRLPNDVIPINYDMTFTIPNNFESVNSFEGTVLITIKTKDEQPTYKKITLNAKDLALTKEELKLYEVGTTKNLLKATDPLTTKKEQEMIELNIQDTETLKKDTTYILKISYKGLFHTDMYGFYLSSYSYNEQVEWMVATHFQPTHARRAFPCFDEPNLKATFAVKITHPKEYEALSNTEAIDITTSDKTTTTTFKTTPIMSTYLNAFVISKLARIIVKSNDGVINGASSPKDLIYTAGYSVKIAPKILDAMADFTGVGYADSGLTKLDQVALPDFPAGAMENWGLVIYREPALLWDPEESTTRDKQGVAATVAHELAHMWFGNLLTTDWWSSTWLNEGFASYFQYYALDKVEKEWDLKNQFVIQKLQPVLNADSERTSQALTSEVFTPTQIRSKFGSITYSKGGSVIRMMEHFMGEANFFKGIKEYLKEKDGHHFANTIPNDLWDAMSKFVEKNTLPEGTTLKGIMNIWTEKPGFPVVTVSASENKVTLEAKRFLFDEKKEDVTESVWHIPISYTTSNAPDFSKTAPTTWLNQKNKVDIDFKLTEEFWIIFNIQASAYIRVNYDEKLWKALQSALHKNHKNIHVMNRAQTTDDALNLARAGIIAYPTAFDVNLYLENEDDYYPWYSAFNALAYLRRRIDSDHELASYLNMHISNLMKKLYASVSFEINPEKLVEIQKKVLALTWACHLNEEECVGKSKELFKALKDNQQSIDPDLRSIVYCTALRHSENEEDWTFLRQQLTKTRMAAERATVISDLGCTTNENLLKKYLDESINPDSDIPKKEAQSIFSAVISGSPKGVSLGLKFLTENYENINKHYAGANPLATAITLLADRFTTQEQIDTFKNFVNETDLKEAAATAESAIKSSEENVKWVRAFQDELLEYLKGRVEGTDTTTEPSTTPGGATSITASSAIFVLSILALFNMC